MYLSTPEKQWGLYAPVKQWVLSTHEKQWGLSTTVKQWDCVYLSTPEKQWGLLSIPVTILKLTLRPAYTWNCKTRRLIHHDPYVHFSYKQLRGGITGQSYPQTCNPN